MIFDFKRLFTKGSTIGRFEYLKINLVLLFIFMPIIILPFIIPNNSLWWYAAVDTLIIFGLAYMIIGWVSIYKRINNIFAKTAISVIILIVFFIFWRIKLLNIIFNILLVIIPGKKKSDFIVSNRLLWLALPSIIILLIVVKYAGFLRWIPSESMADTLQVNDRIFINIFDKNYHRGDIIIHDTDKKGVVFIKRIVALPGEKVEIKTLGNGAKHIFINDKLLEEPYVKDVYNYPECSSQMKCESIIVPEDNYYVLGDNRSESYDSRYYGTIDKNIIKGKVSHIWFPLDRQQVFTTPKYSFDSSIKTDK